MVLDKKKNVCKIDGELIESKNNRAIWLLHNHLKKKHGTSLEEYVLKYYYDDKHPKCECGCGNKTNFHKGDYHNFFLDHSKYIIKPHKNLNIGKNKYDDIENRLKRLGYTINDLYMIYNEFINFKLSFVEIEKKYSIDKRTLKKYWRDLKFINNNETFKRICKKHQYIWSNKNGVHGGKKIIELNVLNEIYLYLKKHKNKHTVNEIVNIFNLSVTGNVLYKRLIENYNEEIIDECLRIGLSSKPEIEYYNVLKYFFKKDIKKDFI